MMSAIKSIPQSNRHYFLFAASFRGRIMLISTVTLVMALSCFVLFSWFSYTHESRARLSATGDIIATDIGAALAFGDDLAITKALAVFKADPAIHQIVVLDSNNKVRACYHQAASFQEGSAAEHHHEAVRIGMGNGSFTPTVVVERAVLKDELQLGTVVIEQNPRVIMRKMMVVLLLGGFFIVMMLVLNFLLANRFQRETTAQISSLTETMQEISITKDFSIRVSRRYNQEMNQLTDCFNQMLSEIAQRDSILLKRQNELHWMANYDLLTGLPNRALFLDRLDQALLHAARIGELLAVLFIDLDDFKLINDTHGHRIGDLLLQMVAQRLAGQTRADDTLARLGGDEFTIFLHNLQSIESGVMVARKHLKNLLEPYVIEGNTLYISASIGVALFPDHGATSELLLKHADTAMYQAKEMGKNHVELFNNGLHQLVSERLNLANDLRGALQRGELELYFQPRISLLDRSWTGAEALLRWHHPEQGMVPPDKFIPLAEETGLILPIGEWVIEEACHQLSRWQADGGPISRLSVNVSPLQLHRQDLTAIIQGALLLNRLDPDCFEVEITESALMRDMEKSIAMLEGLRQIGVKISLDDFGTGYSSLSTLRNLPIDILKIDRSFLLRVHESDNDAQFLAAILSMADTLHIGVVAEGIECAAQEAILKEYGCSEGQGYFYARPMSATDIESMVASSTRQVVWIDSPAIQGGQVSSCKKQLS